jgi:hypothetical protein
MNNFLRSALRVAGDYAYNSMGGKELAAAQRRNAKLQQERGFLGSFADRKYWGDIAKATGKVALNVLPGAAVKAGVGAVRSARAGSQVASNAIRAQRAGQPLPPAVAPLRPVQAPRPANIFDDITPDNPYGLPAPRPAAGNVSRVQAQAAIREEAQRNIAQTQAYRAQQRALTQQAQQQASRAQAIRQPAQVKPSNVARGTFTLAATGGASAAASTQRTKKSAAQIAYEQIGRKKTNRGGK